MAELNTNRKADASFAKLTRRGRPSLGMRGEAGDNSCRIEAVTAADPETEATVFHELVNGGDEGEFCFNRLFIHHQLLKINFLLS